MGRVKVTVAGKVYWLHTEEEEQYVHHLGHLLNDAVETTMLQNDACSLVEALVLSALNAMDEKQKALKDADHLRGQMKQYIDEVQQMNKQLAHLQTENKELLQLLEQDTNPLEQA